MEEDRDYLLLGERWEDKRRERYQQATENDDTTRDFLNRASDYKKGFGEWFEELRIINDHRLPQPQKSLSDAIECRVINPNVTDRQMRSGYGGKER